MSRTTLHLSKQAFKFSSAHFLIFDKKKAERLHGHNYRVRVDLAFENEIDPETGYLTDFNSFKPLIKQALDEWDERVLLPKLQPDMKFKVEGASLHVWFRDRYYVFPESETVLLPVKNTSTEEFSRLLAEKFLAIFKSKNVSMVRVFVEESPGQGASTVCSI